MNKQVTIVKSDTGYDVTYTDTTDPSNPIEIEGTLLPYNTGRCVEHKFEPSEFVSEGASEYYDENWETIEAEILDYFNNVFRIFGEATQRFPQTFDVLGPF